jgi:thiol-disulfide isomerase/thioredoxin
VPYLTAAVAVVGALCVLNLLLTTGVIRRLREHTDLLSGPRPDFSADVIAPGKRPAEFTAADAGGTPVGRADAERAGLVAFFAPDCPACKQSLPDFLAVAARSAEPVLAVVAGGLDDDGRPDPAAAGLLAELGRVARVVPEPHAGPVSEAFGVVAYPSWVLLDGPVVAASAVGMDRLPSPSRV